MASGPRCRKRGRVVRSFQQTQRRAFWEARMGNRSALILLALCVLAGSVVTGCSRDHAGQPGAGPPGARGTNSSANGGTGAGPRSRYAGMARCSSSSLQTELKRPRCTPTECCNFRGPSSRQSGLIAKPANWWARVCLGVDVCGGSAEPTVSSTSRGVRALSRSCRESGTPRWVGICTPYSDGWRSPITCALAGASVVRDM